MGWQQKAVKETVTNDFVACSLQTFVLFLETQQRSRSPPAFPVFQRRLYHSPLRRKGGSTAQWQSPLVAGAETATRECDWKFVHLYTRSVIRRTAFAREIGTCSSRTWSSSCKAVRGEAPTLLNTAEIRTWRHFRWTSEILFDVTSVGQRNTYFTSLPLVCVRRHFVQ